MEKCLERNEVCSNCNKECKECKLDDCKQTFKMIDRSEEKEYDFKIKKIKAQLPRECRNCSLLQILNLDKQKVYCGYRVNNKCILGGKHVNNYTRNNIKSNSININNN